MPFIVVNIIAAAAVATASNGTVGIISDTRGEVESTVPVEVIWQPQPHVHLPIHTSACCTSKQEKDISKKTLRNRKKRSMKKQRQKHQQMTKVDGQPELTEAEVKAFSFILLTEVDMYLSDMYH